MDAKLVDMKQPKKTKEELKAAEPSAPNQEQYPWGLRLNFNDEILTKLGDLTGLEVGDKFHLVAVGSVITRHSSKAQGDKKENRSLELQIEKLALSCHEEESMDQFAKRRNQKVTSKY